MPSKISLFKKNGIYRWSRIYFSQVQAYMGMSGRKRSFVIAINKDTSELHDEEVLFDEMHYSMLKEKAKKIFEYESGL